MKQVCGTLWLDFQTRIWYPFMSSDDFCSKTRFSPEGLQHNKPKNIRQWVIHIKKNPMTNLKTSSGSWDICSDLKIIHMYDFGASTWLIIPSLNTADPAYGAAWSSEGWTHAVPPVFGGRGWCRLSYLQTQSAHQNFIHRGESRYAGRGSVISV